MATLTILPVDRNPDYGRGEFKSAFIVGNQTAVLSAYGGGMVHTVIVGVAGTALALHDIASGVTPAATNQIANISLAAVSTGPIVLDVAFGKGLTAVVTGTNAELTITGKFGGTTKSRFHFPVK